MAPSNVEIIAGVSYEAILSLNPRKTTLAIVNLDKLGGAGTHWISFIIPRGKSPILYFDSLGDKPPRGIVEKLRAAFPMRPILYFDTPTQPDSTDSCGFYALRFISRYLAGERPPALYFGFEYDASNAANNRRIIPRNEKKVLGDLVRMNI